MTLMVLFVKNNLLFSAVCPFMSQFVRTQRLFPNKTVPMKFSRSHVTGNRLHPLFFNAITLLDLLYWFCNALVLFDCFNHHLGGLWSMLTLCLVIPPLPPPSVTTCTPSAIVLPPKFLAKMYAPHWCVAILGLVLTASMVLIFRDAGFWLIFGGVHYCGRVVSCTTKTLPNDKFWTFSCLLGS